MEYGNLTVILPTLNEERNIGDLVSRLLRSYKGASIMVIDDGSSDRTREIVSGIGRRQGKVRLYVRSGMEKGLTASLIYGISRCRTRYFVVMDADLQHPYQLVGELYRELAGGSEIAIAVRENVEEWELYRRIISRSMFFIGYMVLSLRRGETSRDIFSGFFGMKTARFMMIYNRNRRRFVGQGYKLLFDLLKCMPRASVPIAEIPYTFHARRNGRSKAGISQGLCLFKSFIT